MKNIAIIIPNLKGGGAERVVSLLSQELAKRYNLYLIIFDSDDMVYSYGGKLIDINIKSHKSILIKIINIARRVYKTRKVKKQYNIQSSISFLGSANIINTSSGTNDKKIVSIRSNRATGRSGYMGRVNQIIYNRADKIIGVSKGVSNNLVRNYNLDNEKVGTIYNPININEIKRLLTEEIYEESFYSKKCFTIVNMGRLTEAKGQWHLIRALTYVKKEIEDIKLIILGDGELEDYLKNLIEELNLTDNVVFLGHKSNPFKYIKLSDIFVLSSIYEGFPNVLIEAMACGTAIISTDCKTGPREALAPSSDVEYETKDIEYAEYGVLVPTCDGIKYGHDDPLTKEEEMLARSIIELYKNDAERIDYSSKGYQRAKDFEIQSIISKWENII